MLRRELQRQVGLAAGRQFFYSSSAPDFLAQKWPGGLGAKSCFRAGRRHP